MEKYIGFDIDSNKTIACVVQNGEKDRFSKIDSDIDSMKEYLKQERADGSKTHLTFEISGQAGYLYDSLQRYADTITVNNPVKVTWIYRTAKKNDRIDARKQAVLLSIGEIPKVYMPNKKIRQWRNMILHRRNLVGRCVQLKNRTRAVLKSQGIVKACCSGSWWKWDNRVWMKKLSQFRWSSGQLWRMQLAHLLEELELLETQVKSLTQYLDASLSKRGGGALLMSIPGVGPRTAEAVLAYTDDIHRFKGSKEFCAYFGLTPKLDESGSTRRLGHISKQGPSVVRWLVGESAWRVVKQSPAMCQFYEKVMNGQTNRKKIAIVAVARKLLSIMRAMMQTGEAYNEALVCRQEHVLSQSA